jgi:hypothetical protein
MLNLGLIGDITLLEPYAQMIHDRPGVHIAGKSSVGMNTDTKSFCFSIPEFNRIELVERSEALLINRFSLLSFQLLCNIVKKSKHIFAAEYPALNFKECQQLAKLAKEAKTIVQVTNPFFFYPAIQWMNKNLKKTAFIDISFFKEGLEGIEPLLPLLLMLKGLGGIVPKKTGVVSFHPAPAKSEFTNVRLEFGDASVVNINFGRIGSHEEFKVRAWTAAQVISLNFTAGNYTCNDLPIDLSHYKGANELDVFIENTTNKDMEATGLEEYLTGLQIIQNIKNKMAQFLHTNPD